jgi:hypothetical protein
MQKYSAIMVLVTSTATVLSVSPAFTQTLPAHRIGVRTVNGIGEFYDRTTNTKFTLRGNNHIRLAAQTKYNGSVITYHSTFNVGQYDVTSAEQALTLMQSRDTIPLGFS